MIEFKALRTGAQVFIRGWEDIISVEAIHATDGVTVTGSHIVTAAGTGHQVTAMPADIAEEKGDVPPLDKKAKTLPKAD